MPARIVLVDDDPDFIARTVAALREALSQDVLSFTNSPSALDALEGVERIELLITRVQFPPGQPHGVALARITRMKQRGVKVLFMSRPENVEFTEGVGEVLVFPLMPADVVAKAREMLASTPPVPILPGTTCSFGDEFVTNRPE